MLFQIREIVSKTKEKKQQTKIILVKFYYKEKWAACFGAIFFTGMDHMVLERIQKYKGSITQPQHNAHHTVTF